MNKVFNINLGGYPFTIDADAYDYLSKYLKTIHRHFRDSEGYEEITSDIEARMAELFQESKGNHPIVTIKTVEEAISIMGTPEDFGATTEEPTTQKSSSAKQNYKTGKRLFRDPDDEVVAGVCSGIAAYFGIPDPLWVRIAFVVLTFSFGFSVPVYILLAVLVPKAKNSSDRLAMRGDAINVSNIAKIVEEEITNISERITEITDNWDTKKKSFTTTDGTARRTLKEGILVLGKFIRHIIQVIPLIFKPLIFIVGFALTIAFIVIWILSIISFFLGAPFAQALTPDQPLLSFLGVINLAFIIGIPILSLALLAGRLVFKTKYNVRWSRSLAIVWGLNIACIFGVGSYLLSQFSVNQKIETFSKDINTDQEVLTISANENPYKDAWIRLGHIDIAGKELASTDVQIHIEEAKGDKFQISQEVTARGSDLQDATASANLVRHNFDIADNQITMNPYFVLNQGEKWRAQKAIITLSVPVGKSVKFDNLPRSIRQSIRLGNPKNYYYHNLQNGEVWTMTQEGLTNPTKKRPQNHQKNHTKGHRIIQDYKDFSKLQLEGSMKVTITKGDKFEVELDGKEDYLNSIQLTQTGELLEIRTNLRETFSPIRAYITMPSLSALDITHTDDIRLNDFTESTLSITGHEESRAEIKANINVNALNIDLGSRQELDLRGSGDILRVDLKERAHLDAERFSAKKVNIKISNRATASLAVSDSVYQTVLDRGKIKIDGNPVIVKNN